MKHEIKTYTYNYLHLCIHLYIHTSIYEEEFHAAMGDMSRVPAPIREVMWPNIPASRSSWPNSQRAALGCHESGNLQN